VELEAGVELLSSVGEAVVLPGGGDAEAAGLAVAVADAAGEIVKLGVGDGLALPGEGLGEGDTAGLGAAVADEAGEIVKLGAGDGVALPVGGVATVAADVGVSDGSRLGGDGVADGAGGVPVFKTGEPETSACEMPEAPSADEARGKWRNNKSPTSDRPPAGLNRRIFTPSP